MVGAVRFELTTSCTRNKRASQATLRPDTRQQRVPRAGDDCNPEVKNDAILSSGIIHRRVPPPLPTDLIDTGFAGSDVSLSG
jgi:hypothetical protein